MLTKLSDVPDSVLGFRASGELTSDDLHQPNRVPCPNSHPPGSCPGRSLWLRCLAP
jgi:hypothetical protein